MRFVLPILLACILFVISGCGSGSSVEKPEEPDAMPTSGPQTAPAPAPATPD